MIRPPNSKVNLDRAIQRVYGTGARYVEIRSIMANAIVAQFLKNGVVKGGSALRLRYGLNATRVTTDFDVAYAKSLDRFLDDLASGLKEGWNGFTGVVVRREPARPADVPPAYVMRPFDVKLAYNRQPWCTVRLELGYNEIGDADDCDVQDAGDVAEIFQNLCLPVPKPPPLMPLCHQVAQKLHGASEPGSARAHDLVDLQLIFRFSALDKHVIRRIAHRLFANRQKQPWPPQVEKGANWDALYVEAAMGLPVLPNCDEAIKWTNELIAEIDKA